MELWQYSGEPVQEEILKLEPYHKDNSLAIRHRCPNCGGHNTAWRRDEWSVCFTCVIAFTLEDSLGYYDVPAYEQDIRIEEELLEEV